MKDKFQVRPGAELSVEIYSTAPQSAGYEGRRYLSQLGAVARWSDDAGCTGILIYSDNSLVDPWLAAQVVIANTDGLSPLVAVQPVYMHPFSAARMVASLSYFYNRRISLNMIAGGFRTDLLALCDETPHDQRYARLTEYTLIIQGLLSAQRPFSFSGTFYNAVNLTVKPA